MNGLTVGVLAKQGGVGVETIRFYERRGLLVQPKRPVSGFRTYPTETVSRVLFIRRAKELGFSLREIHELLNLQVSSTSSCSEVRRRAEYKIADIENKMETLKSMKKVLSKLVSACNAARASTPCPILSILEAPAEPGKTTFK